MNIITSGTQVVQQLPGGGNFDISSIDGWEDLEPKQKVYLLQYADSLGQNELTRILTGVTRSDLQRWADDHDFIEIRDTIDIIFTEGLASLDYMESVTNGKIRGRVLQARKAKGYEVKSGTHNTQVNVIGEGGLANIMKLINQ